jgi:hypothetical protein
MLCVYTVELLRQDPPETFEMSNSQTRPDLSTSPQIVEELHVGMPCLNGSFDPVYTDMEYIGKSARDLFI